MVSDDDLQTEPEVVAKHAQLEKLVNDKMVARSARRLNTAMEKTEMTVEKLDGVCGPLEKNEQAEDEASQTLEFVSQQEWLDANLDDSEKLTVYTPL